MSTGKGVLVAIMSGVLLSGGTYMVLFFLFRETQAGAEFSLDDMVGRTVQVITTIPECGTGEIAVEAKGSRTNGPARSVDGRAIPRNSAVRVVRVVGNLYYVQEIDHGAENRQGQSPQ
jgi:membrane-bound ClpP family serine protease